MTVTSSQQEALERPVVPLAYFAFFDFASAQVRVSNFNQTVTWGGYEWAGVGVLGAVSEVTETDGLESSPLNFTLNVSDVSLLALAIGPVEEYRGRAAKMYMCPLTPEYQLIDEPVLCWSGFMDMMSIGLGDSEGQVVLKCETSAYGLKRQPSLRMNASQQKKKYQTDTGFDYQNDLMANPAVWVSKKFQQI